MRSIHKSAEPQSLQVFRKAGHSDWSEIYNQCAYQDCLSQCVYDQGELDGYTEMVLDNTRHIDHYVCRRFDPKMTFRWTNMVAAVRDSRFGANYKDTSIKTVHYDKTNGRYLNLYNPVTDDMKGVFSYYSDGSICPSDKQDIKAGCTIEFFNLNEKSLKERRRSIMEAARGMHRGGLSSEYVFEMLKTGGFISCLEYEIEQLY